MLRKKCVDTFFTFSPMLTIFFFFSTQAELLEFSKIRCATKEDLYLPPRDFRYHKSSFTRFHISNYALYVCMYSCDPSDRHNRDTEYIIDKCDSE